jgi:predicted nucleic acid-binding protein
LIAVLDASAAVRAVMDPGTAFRATLRTADLVIAPELIVAEVCSAFRKYVRAGVLSSGDAVELIESALSRRQNAAAARSLA